MDAPLSVDVPVADDDRACVRTAASMAGPDRRSDATATIAAAIRFLDIATSKRFHRHSSQPLFTATLHIHYSRKSA
jgi:hypothetical protein